MLNEDYVKKVIEEGSRVDGRAFDQLREIKIKKDIISSADGSAIVTIGNTHLLVGIKLSVGEPFPDTPNEGILIVNTELVPIASPDFESGPPKPEAIEISRVIDRGIRESHCIELEKLCIEPREKVWMINIDVHVLDYDGNLIDAGALGSIVALLNTKMPKYEDEKIIREETTGNLPIVDIPIAITTGKLSKKLLIDTNLIEEGAIEARITITTNKKGDICAVQKGGEGYFTTEELKQAVELSINKGKEIRDLI